MGIKTEDITKLVFSTPDYSSLKQETKENLKKGVFDYLVCYQATFIYDRNLSNILEATIYSEGEYLNYNKISSLHPFDQCLVMGYAAHALDIDDGHSDIRGHPSAVILTLLMTLARNSNNTYRFYEAYLVGVEVMSKLSKILGNGHYEKGFHTTATAGLYGAVSAGAYFLNYNSIKFSQSIDLCISQISGSRVHFGSVIKPLHVGLTAQKAWQIINFVGKGVSGNANTITGDNSLSSMYVENFTPTKEVFN